MADNRSKPQDHNRSDMGNKKSPDSNFSQPQPSGAAGGHQPKQPTGGGQNSQRSQNRTDETDAE